MTDDRKRIHVFMIAGEPSGDALGSYLIKELKNINKSEIYFSGVGGPLMTSAGLRSLFDYRQLAVMGFAEVLPSLPRILMRIRQVSKEIDRVRPDIIVTIDSPSFSLRVLKKLKRHSQPRIHYVAPQFWAWRPKLIYKFKLYVDHVLALFPFETDFFKKFKMPCSFVSHPAIETRSATYAGREFRKKLSINQNSIVLCALPGSRLTEVKKLLPIMIRVIEKLALNHKDLHVIIPTVSTVKGLVEKTKISGVPVTIIDNSKDKYDAYAASDIAITASGTATLELACASVPSVVIYKVSWLTGLFARFLLKVKHVSIVNLIAQKEVLPEFIQENCNSTKIFNEVNRLIVDRDLRHAIISDENAVIKKLQISDVSPSRKAALEVMRIKREFR